MSATYCWMQRKAVNLTQLWVSFGYMRECEACSDVEHAEWWKREKANQTFARLALNKWAFWELRGTYSMLMPFLFL